MNPALVTAAQLHLLHHTLGVTPERRNPYRNHFVAGRNHHDQPDLDALESAGLMRRGTIPAFCAHDDVVFQCTETGRAYALEQLPPRPKRTRYQEYLESEYPDSFADWLGIEVPRRQFGGYYGETKGMYRYETSKARGEWKPTVKEAKASYKAELAKTRGSVQLRHTLT